MITSIEIENLRGIRTGRLEGLTPLTILTGPNGCGKSTVLDALLIGASQDPAEGLKLAVERHPVTLTGVIWLFSRLGKTATLKITDETHRVWPYRLELNKGRSKTWGVTITGKRDLRPFKRAHVTFRAEKTAELGEVKEGLADAPVSFVRLIDPGIATPLHETFSAAARLSRKEEVEALLRELIPGFRDLAILTEDNAPVLYLATETSVVPVSVAGDGIQALVQIAVEIAAAPGGLVLLEEPEVYQHPGAIWQTAKALLFSVRRGVQIVLTTHSLELIDALLSEASEQDVAGMSVFNLLLKDGELRHGRRLGSEITFARQNMESDLR